MSAAAAEHCDLPASPEDRPLDGLELALIYDTDGHTHPGPERDTKGALLTIACDDGSDPVAREAVEWFVLILGTVAGNLALIHLPFGGIYLIGGVTRAVTPYFETFGFSDSFRDKGRFAGFMKNFAVWVVEDDFAALSGMANHMAGKA